MRKDGNHMKKGHLYSPDEIFNEEQLFFNGTYLFVRDYATKKNCNLTLKALPLARQLHQGQYRKGRLQIGDKDYKLPYVSHVLKVCTTLMALDLPFEETELDLLFASALLHDSIEDVTDIFDGTDDCSVMLSYGMTKDVYNCVQSVSKKHNCTDDELNTYFDNIKNNKLTLLIKLADRSHNVEDLYNMKPAKLHEYVRETRKWIYPLAQYGMEAYPEISNSLTILQSKIVSLTECTETIINKYEQIIKEKDEIIQSLYDKK